MCTHSYCFPSALVSWSTSAALQRIYSAAVPCFSFKFKSLWTDEETHAEREHNDPLKEAQLYSSIACHSWCCGMWGRVTKALDHPAWQNYWETSLYCKTSTSRNTAQTSHLNTLTCRGRYQMHFHFVHFKVQSLHLWLFAFLFFTLSLTQTFSISLIFFSLSCSSSFWIILFVSNIQRELRG